MNRRNEYIRETQGFLNHVRIIERSVRMVKCTLAISRMSAASDDSRGEGYLLRKSGQIQYIVRIRLFLQKALHLFPSQLHICFDRVAMGRKVSIGRWRYTFHDEIACFRMPCYAASSTYRSLNRHRRKSHQSIAHSSSINWLLSTSRGNSWSATSNNCTVLLTWSNRTKVSSTWRYSHMCNGQKRTNDLINTSSPHIKWSPWRSLHFSNTWISCFTA